MRQLKISQSITNRESASLQQYLSDIAKIPMVTAQEEVILTQKINHTAKPDVSIPKSLYITTT